MRRTAIVELLTYHENCLALVIDRGVLDLLEIDAHTPLSVTSDGTYFEVSSGPPSSYPRYPGNQANGYILPLCAGLNLLDHLPRFFLYRDAQCWGNGERSIIADGQAPQLRKRAASA